MSIKNELDQYYTSTEYSQYCYDKAKEIISNKLDFDKAVLLEPCVGTGSFYNLFSENEKVGFDISPNTDDKTVIKGDFLLQDNIIEVSKDVIVISNPPFGRLSSLAVKFFNKCASFSNVKYICFIVPLTFRKVATQNKLDTFFHLIHDEDSPNKCFILHGEPHNVPCCFQIWECRDSFRKTHSIKNESNLFSFCAKEFADIQIKRVGTKAGELAEIGEEHKDASMYYIKTVHKDKIRNIMKTKDYLNDIHEIRKTTAGVYCVSKSELVSTIEKYFKND